MNSNFKNNSGMTLMEVMIAMFVLAFISLGIYQATVETYKLRDVLSREGDFYNSIRLSMNIFQRDVSLIYNPMLMQPPKPTATTPPTTPPPPSSPVDTTLDGDLGQSTQFWGATTDKTGIRPCHFIGTNSKMSFISTSHIRVYKDAPESELSKIVFEIERDEKNQDLGETYVLKKSSSPNVFEEDSKKDKFWVTVPLLSGIKKFKFRYYRKDKDRWETSWDTDKEDFKEIYPDKVEIQLEVIGPFQLNFEGTYVFRPEIPINGLDPST